MNSMKLLIVLSIFVTTHLFAQTKPSEPKKQSLNFEDELVEGETQKPDLFYLLQKKQFNYKRLIKLREDFIPEMKKSAEEIQRQRSRH